MKKMSPSDASEIIIDVKDVRPAQRHSKCCIYKVPNKLREVKEEAYTPKLISSEAPTRQNGCCTGKTGFYTLFFLVNEMLIHT